MKKTVIVALFALVASIALADIRPPAGNYSTKFSEKTVTGKKAEKVLASLNPAETQVQTEPLRIPVTHKIWNSKDGLNQIHCTFEIAVDVKENVSCTTRKSEDGKRLAPVVIPRRLG